MEGSRRQRIHRFDEFEETQVCDDAVAVEEPLEIRVGGKSTTVIMRTPGHDEELARGFLFGEGLIGRPEEVGKRQWVRCIRPGDLKAEEIGNVLDVEVSAPLVGIGRNFYATSSCGVCGKASLNALAVHAKPVESRLRMDARCLSELPERLREGQRWFGETGGHHGAGLFTAKGSLLCVREDVGRHNAVDKIFGWAHAGGFAPMSELLLCVSGRTSFEIVQKAVMSGVSLIVAVSAPSSLAIDLAERFGVTLCGFARGAGLNVYAHPERVA